MLPVMLPVQQYRENNSKKNERPGYQVSVPAPSDAFSPERGRPSQTGEIRKEGGKEDNTGQLMYS